MKPSPHPFAPPGGLPCTTFLTIMPRFAHIPHRCRTPHPTPPRPAAAPVSQLLPVTSPLHPQQAASRSAGWLAVQPVRDWTRFLFLCLSENSRTQTVGHCQWLSTTKADLSRHGVACPGVGVICLSLKFAVTRVCDCTYM